MELKELLRKIEIFNNMVNKNHETRSETERLVLKSMKIWEEVWEFYNEILWSVWFTRAWKEHSRDELEKECADVILSTLLVACDLWIKIDEVLENKINLVFERFNLKDE